MFHTNTYTPHNENNFIPCGHFTPGHIAQAIQYESQKLEWKNLILKNRQKSE